MKIWILLAIAVLLLVWGLRERFEETQSIRAPPYDDTEKLRILDMVNNADKEELIRQAKQQDASLEKKIADAQTAHDNATSDKKQSTQATLDTAKRELLVKAASIISPAVATFFTEKFKPATAPITNEDVEKYVKNLQETANKTILERLLKRYFVGQSGIGTSVASGYAAKLESLGQEAGYNRPNQPGSTAQPPVPAGGAGGETSSASSSTPAGADTTGATGTAESTAPPGSGGVATTTGTTTGGSSTSSPGPTSGGGGRFGIWGPISGGRGESSAYGDGAAGRDSTKTTQYPELLGGMNAGGDRTRIDGIGLTEPSKSWKLSMSGMLPSSDSLGSGDLSKYLPWSRTPGDMDKIPDPYRVSRTFTTSSYSSKTEPVPFLADFSAFQR